MGDGNIGAANAFRQLGARVGLTVGVIDAGKGALAVLIAQAAGIPQIAILITGIAVVLGHNWPFLLGFIYKLHKRALKFNALQSACNC